MKVAIPQQHFVIPIRHCRFYNIFDGMIVDWDTYTVILN